jgi:hypothetical protein
MLSVSSEILLMDISKDPAMLLVPQQSAKQEIQPE